MKTMKRVEWWGKVVVVANVLAGAAFLASGNVFLAVCFLSSATSYAVVM